jgi:outer membrane protein OmpA-like peptidoglycan-associated protein
MKPITYIIVLIFIGLLAGCAANIPPSELISARQSYQKASTGQAAQLVPAELHKAKVALDLAEQSFLDEPESFRTSDLAYIADRKAKIAEALAVTVASNEAMTKADKDYQTIQAEIMKNRTEQIASAQKAQLEAENKTAKVQADLAKLAAVKEEGRGMVITLSGSVVFTSNKSALLPSAQNRLNKVADALLETKERNLTIEGYTDSQGSSEYNQNLSQQRANVVREFLISRGYPGNLIKAQGMGESSPIADNSTAEGRANNRRVEIVVDHNTY